MEPRGPRERAPPRAVRSEEARGLPQDLRGRRLQDLDARRAGDQAKEGEAGGRARDRGRRGRRASTRGEEVADTEGGRKSCRRRTASEVRTAPRARRRASRVRSLAVQGLRRCRRQLPRLRRATPEGRGARSSEERPRGGLQPPLERPPDGLRVRRDHVVDERPGAREVHAVVVVRRLADAVSPARHRDDILDVRRGIDEERGPTGVPEAGAAISMLDVLRHVEPGVVQVPEARGRDLTVPGHDEVLVVSVSDVDERRRLEFSRRGKVVQVARRGRLAKGDALHRILKDDHTEVVGIRCGSPVVIWVALISAYSEAHRPFRKQVWPEPDPQPGGRNREGRERIGAVARGQEDPCGYERPGTELPDASVGADDEDRPDVWVGRVERAPGDRGGGRAEHHHANHREHANEHTSTHDSPHGRTPRGRMVGNRHKRWRRPTHPIRRHSNVQWSRSRKRSRNRWVAFPRSTCMRNAPRCLHMSRPVARFVLKSTQSCSTRFSCRSIRTEYSFTRPARSVSVSLSTETTDGSMALADARRFLPRNTSRSSSKDSLSMSLFIGTSAWIVPASSSISPPLILTATPNRSSASLIFLSMYACSSGVYFARFRGSLKYRRAARAWNGVCTGYFQFAGSPYFSGSFG